MPRPLHPVLTREERDELHHTAVEQFNRGRFFAAHEAWEEIWRSTDPHPVDLWQGLIQVSVGLHHYLVRGRPAPARRVLGRGLRRLEPFPQGTEGLDLEALRVAGRAWERWLEDPRGDPPSRPEVRLLPLGPL